MKLHILVIFAVLLSILCASAVMCLGQSDDITRMGDVHPLYYLEDVLQATVITYDNEELTVTINDIAVESNRILVRFFVTDLPDSWKDKITDDTRLYGSYLPVAELVLDDGTILTPSSASRYSLLEYNSRIIIGGLMEFLCDSSPQVFYFNFNQIPFSTQPLQEGFSKALILTVLDGEGSGSPLNLSDNHDGIEFTLSAAAQTNELTMLQPAVRMDREDELLSKFGWISFTDMENGKKYAVTRGNLYGFNLTDDSVYSPAHAYVFDAISNETVLEISMDHAYIVRSYESFFNTPIDLNTSDPQVLLDDGTFHLTLKDLNIDNEASRIRLYIDAGEHTVSDISFQFTEANGTIPPNVYCGIDPDNDQFACDVYFGDNSFPQTTLAIGIDAIEYLQEGPWSIYYHPVQMESHEAPSVSLLTTGSTYNYYQSAEPKPQPDAVQQILNSLNAIDRKLLQEPGWIHESYLLNYTLDQSGYSDLIQSDQYDLYLTNYISETWYHADGKGNISEVLTAVRKPDDFQIVSAQLQKEGKVLDLLHALLSDSGSARSYGFESFSDFRDLADSSAVFISASSCPSPYDGEKCIEFNQSLSGIPGSRGSQQIIFRISSEDDFIKSEYINYDYGTLILDKTTLTLEETETLPEDIQTLIDAIQ